MTLARLTTESDVKLHLLTWNTYMFVIKTKVMNFFKKCYKILDIDMI